MQTFKIYTLGCKVNQYDSQLIREDFLRRGFKEIDSPEKTDIYVINTCTVTRKADRDSRRLIYLAQRKNPQARIVVTGCYTELDSDEIVRIPGLTHIVKNQDKHKIAGLLNGQNEHNAGNEHNVTGISFFSAHTRAFLKIQDGCNNFCSYCKVPLVRGKSRSRPLNEIIPEVARLIKNGYKEIVLSGICLGSYGRDLSSRSDLADVLERLEGLAGHFRIRLSSIEAWDITERLVDVLKACKRICPHLHIPIQSGDDTILKKMQRQMNSGDYLKVINKLKKTIPSLAITTDVIVGFPGENETDFQRTLELIKEIAPLKVHIFPYSERAGTPAAENFKYTLNPDVIRERVSLLKEIASVCALAYKKQFLHKNLEVLIERGYRDNGCAFWQGYTGNYLKVRLKSEKNLKNQIVGLKLKSIANDSILADFY